MADILVSIGGKILEYTVEPIGRQISYLVNYKRYIDDLRTQVDDLDAVRKDLETKVEATKRNAQPIAAKYDQWKQKVDNVIRESMELLPEDVDKAGRCMHGYCPNPKSRYFLSHNARKNYLTAKELAEEEKSLIICLPIPPPNVASTSTEAIEVSETRETIMRSVLIALKDDTKKIVGLWGSGGVGKTTLAKEIMKRSKSEDLFDEFAMAIVSQNPDPLKIQAQIAECLGLNLTEKYVLARACRLRDRLCHDDKRKLVILDDVWKELDLNEIGISFEPQPTSKFYNKIIMTTRSLSICKQMRLTNKEIFQVPLMSEMESWNLFQEMVGHHVENNNHLFTIAKDIVKECGCLPVAIVTIGKALRDTLEPSIWEDINIRLKRAAAASVSNMDEYVYSRIEVSYNFVKSKESKSCFLLCCLFPEDFEIPLELLARYGMALKIFERVITLTEAWNRVKAIVDYLKSSSLLVDSDKMSLLLPHSDCVKMHDVVRDAAIWIASKGDPWYLVNHDGTWPSDFAYENCAAISFICDEVQRYHEGQVFPKLQMLKPALVKKISVDFFEGIEHLKVLDILGSRYPFIPKSLKLLKNLQTLILENCKLKEFQIIGELEFLRLSNIFGLKHLETNEGKGFCNLKELEANWCNDIEYLIRWSEKGNHMQRSMIFHRLASLEISKCFKLEKGIPLSIARCLPQLISLYFGGCYSLEEIAYKEEEEANRDDSKPQICLFALKRLTLYNLTNLKCFCKAIDDIEFPQLEELILGGLSQFEGFCHHETALLFGLGSFPVNLKMLEVSSIKLPLQSAIFQLDNPNIIKRASQSTSIEVLPNLRELRLAYLENLEHIWSDNPFGIQGFSNLRSLNISNCDNLENICSSSIVRLLSNLEEINIFSCWNLKEIILVSPTEEEEEEAEGEGEEEDEEQEAETITFPCLKRLKLDSLGSLKNFCNGDIALDMPSLKDMVVTNCLKLKEFAKQVPNTPKLTEVEINGVKHSLMEDLNATIERANISWRYLEDGSLDYVVDEDLDAEPDAGVMTRNGFGGC